MTLPVELREVAKQIKDRMSAHKDWERQVRGLQPRWVGRLLTSLVVAVGSDSASEVEYVSCSAVDGAYEVVVVTPVTIVHGVVQDPSSDSGEFSVRVAKRSDITSLSFSHWSSALENESFVSWPGDPRLTLHHRELGDIRLPLGDEPVDNIDSDERELLLTALLGELRA